MAAEQTTTRTRRAVIGAALGGAAAVAAQAIAPLTARAADGETALMGAANQAAAETSFENTDDTETSLVGLHSLAGTGIRGSSLTGTGVRGTVGDTSADTIVPTETGVYGYADTSAGAGGVLGHSIQGFGVAGIGDTGVYASGYWGVYAQGAIATTGDAGVAGVGVYGWTGTSAPAAPPLSGIGVYARAETTSQVALHVEGKARFSRSRRISFTSSQASKKVSMPGVTSASYVIATMQTNVTGLYVRSVVCTTGAFTIYLSKAPGKTAYVGYLVIN